MVVVESLKLDQPVEAALFAFNAAESAKLVDAFERPGAKSAGLLGKAAPGFTLRDLSGMEVRLKDYAGKTVLLDFWATWCAPCKAEIPMLEKLHREGKAVVLGIDVGEEEELVKKFVAENKMTYPILLTAMGMGMAKDYGVDSYPTVAVVDGSGVIKAVTTGYGTDTEARIERAITGQPEPASGGTPQPLEGFVPPRVLSNVDPKYSEEARKAKVQGKVVVSFDLTVAGEPTNLKVTKGLGSGLDEQAIEAVMQWRYRPATKDGEPVSVHVAVDVNFRLLDDELKAPTIK